MLHYIWASPATSVGLMLGLAGLITGGRCQLVRGCLEFHGGVVTWFLRRGKSTGGVWAMTLGHVIVGQNEDCLTTTRDHEHVHVRQYERWGPAFIPAYLGASLVLWIRKSDPYRSNPFEVEASGISDPGKVQKTNT